jgi:hypothetical protein
MSDALSTFTELLNKPEAAWGGRMAAGAILAGIVWKFFDKVEGVLADQTKFEIAVWLVGRQVSKNVKPPVTVANMFDDWFGKKHWSWRCFLISALMSMALFWTVTILIELSIRRPSYNYFSSFSLGWMLIAVVTDYLSLLQTRRLLSWIGRQKYVTMLAAIMLSSLLSLVLSLGGTFCATILLCNFSGSLIDSLQWPSEVWSLTLVGIADAVRSLDYSLLINPGVLWFHKDPAGFTEVSNASNNCGARPRLFGFGSTPDQVSFSSSLVGSTSVLIGSTANST